MDHQKQILNYATPKRRAAIDWYRLPVRVLWALILINIYAGAIIGPVFVVLCIVNLSHPVEGLYVFGRPVMTARDKIASLICGSAMSVLFVSLAVWHARRWSRASEHDSSKSETEARKRTRGVVSLIVLVIIFFGPWVYNVLPRLWKRPATSLAVHRARVSARDAASGEPIQIGIGVNSAFGSGETTISTVSGLPKTDVSSTMELTWRGDSCRLTVNSPGYDDQQIDLSKASPPLVIVNLKRESDRGGAPSATTEPR